MTHECGLLGVDFMHV